MKLINKHKRWCEKGRMSSSGLCMELIDTKYESALELFKPNQFERDMLKISELSTGWWGSGVLHKNGSQYFTYTEMRQNIVLLICAMHDEL